MWISNTATTAMMFPIGLSIIAHLSRTSANKAQVRCTLAMMLITSFGPSIGGMGTPVGTPPNPDRHRHAREDRRAADLVLLVDGHQVPIVAMLFAYLVTQFYFSSVRGFAMAEGSIDLVQLERLGKPTAGQRNVLIAFAITILLWIAPA